VHAGRSVHGHADGADAFRREQPASDGLDGDTGAYAQPDVGDAAKASLDLHVRGPPGR